MISVTEHASLIGLNTFGIKAGARYLVQLDEEKDVQEFLSSPLARHQPLLILGSGSNILFINDFNGVIVHPRIRGIEVESSVSGHEVIIKAAAGEPWDDFVGYCVKRDFGGLENLSLIPGSVGACPVQNIGAYGVEVSGAIEKVEGVDLQTGRKQIFSSKKCMFGYRDSVFKHEWKDRLLIMSVTFRLTRNHVFSTRYAELERELDNFAETSPDTIRQAVIAIRRRKLPDPSDLGNAGSFFKNPIVSKDKAASLLRTFPTMPRFDAADGQVKLSAAWLIEKSGWKARKLGNAGTYKKQPLILVNHGNASGAEILELAKQISRTVMNRFAIPLETEVRIV